MNFLYWNLNKRVQPALVAEIAHEHEVDVLMFAESTISPIDLLKLLNARKGYTYFFSISPSKYISIYIRLPRDSVRLIQDTERISIRTLTPPVGVEVLLVVAHLPSKLHQTEDDQMAMCTEIISLIQHAEQKVGHNRTIVVGDLNMDPFDKGLVASVGFHAVMDKKIALRGSRVVQGKEYAFFYNPMWGQLGDTSPGPPGTYFYQSSNYVSLFWHTFDQVLLRPSVLEYFKNDAVRVISGTKSVGLLSDSGIPNSSMASDHLPILLKLNIERGSINGRETSMG